MLLSLEALVTCKTKTKRQSKWVARFKYCKNYGSSFYLRQKSRSYFILIHYFKTIHSYDLHEFSAWVALSGHITHASVQALVYGKKVMRYGYILRSTQIKCMNKKVRLGWYFECIKYYILPRLDYEYNYHLQSRHFSISNVCLHHLWTGTQQPRACAR